MSDETNVDAGSETSGNTVDLPGDGTSAPAPAQPAPADASAPAGGAADVQPKAGDDCTNADGVAGILQDDGQGNLVYVVPNTPTPVVGQTCTLSDGSEGVLQADGSGGLICTAKPVPTGSIPDGAKAGDPCTCPNGKPGTLQPLGNAEGALICLENQG